jgi:hypothetical protein
MRLLTQGSRDLLHGFNAGAHGLAAPFIEELAGPSGGVVIPELLKGFLKKVSANGFQVVAEQVAQPPSAVPFSDSLRASAAASESFSVLEPDLPGPCGAIHRRGPRRAPCSSWLRYETDSSLCRASEHFSRMSRSGRYHKTRPAQLDSRAFDDDTRILLFFPPLTSSSFAARKSAKWASWLQCLRIGAETRGEEQRVGKRDAFPILKQDSPLRHQNQPPDGARPLIRRYVTKLP